MEGVRQGAPESLQGALVPDRPIDVADLAMHSSWIHSKSAHFPPRSILCAYFMCLSLLFITPYNLASSCDIHHLCPLYGN